MEHKAILEQHFPKDTVIGRLLTTMYENAAKEGHGEQASTRRYPAFIIKLCAALASEMRGGDYNAVRELLGLPSLQCLAKAPTSTDEGPDYAMLQTLRWRFERERTELAGRTVMLAFGRMKCSQGVLWDPKTGEIAGYDTLGFHSVVAQATLLDAQLANEVDQEEEAGAAGTVGGGGQRDTAAATSGAATQMVFFVTTELTMEVVKMPVAQYALASTSGQRMGTMVNEVIIPSACGRSPATARRRTGACCSAC